MRIVNPGCQRLGIHLTLMKNLGTIRRTHKKQQVRCFWKLEGRASKASAELARKKRSFSVDGANDST